MRRRSRRRTLAGWNSSAELASKDTGRSIASGRIRRGIRVGALLAVIGLIRIARVMRRRRRLLLLLAGGVLAVTGLALSSWTFIAGMLVILLAVQIPQDSSAAFTDPALMPFLVDTQTGRTWTYRPPAR